MKQQLTADDVKDFESYARAYRYAAGSPLVINAWLYDLLKAAGANMANVLRSARLG